MSKQRNILSQYHSQRRAIVRNFPQTFLIIFSLALLLNASQHPVHGLLGMCAQPVARPPGRPARPEPSSGCIIQLSYGESIAIPRHGLRPLLVYITFSSAMNKYGT